MPVTGARLLAAQEAVGDAARVNVVSGDRPRWVNANGEGAACDQDIERGDSAIGSASEMYNGAVFEVKEGNSCKGQRLRPQPTEL